MVNASLSALVLPMVVGSIPTPDILGLDGDTTVQSKYFLEREGKREEVRRRERGRENREPNAVPPPPPATR